MVDNILISNNKSLEGLVEELEAMYPLRNPSPKDEDRTLMFKAGQRSVVEYIKAKLQA